MQATYKNMKCTPPCNENANELTVNHHPDSLLDHAELSLSIQSKKKTEKKSKHLLHYISHHVDLQWLMAFDIIM